MARRQLAALGFGSGAIDRRLALRRLHPIHRGVYAVGHPAIGVQGRWIAAVLACGPGAMLSHRTAGAHLGLLTAAGPRVDVTVPGRRGRRRRGIVLHRPRTLHPCDRSVRDGIPVTSVARTLLDLAGVIAPRRLASAFEQAEREGLLDMRALHAMYERSVGRRGRRALGRLLAEAREPPDVRSELERRFAALCERHALPRPALNVRVGDHTVDALWPAERLVVELDGFAFHRSRRSFEADRARDGDLQQAGYRVLRLTHRRLRDDPAEVAAVVRSLLGRRYHPP